MTGAEALAAFHKADALVKAGKFSEALAVEMLPSDRAVIEAKIAAHMAASANSGAVLTKETG